MPTPVERALSVARSIINKDDVHIESHGRWDCPDRIRGLNRFLMAGIASTVLLASGASALTGDSENKQQFDFGQLAERAQAAQHTAYQVTLGQLQQCSRSLSLAELTRVEANQCFAGQNFSVFDSSLVSPEQAAMSHLSWQPDAVIVDLMQMKESQNYLLSLAMESGVSITPGLANHFVEELYVNYGARNGLDQTPMPGEDGYLAYIEQLSLGSALNAAHESQSFFEDHYDQAQQLHYLAALLRNSARDDQAPVMLKNVDTGALEQVASFIESHPEQWALSETLQLSEQVALLQQKYGEIAQAESEWVRDRQLSEAIEHHYTEAPSASLGDVKQAAWGYHPPAM